MYLHGLAQEIGDAYTCLAVERDSNLLLAHHFGRRTSDDAHMLAAKLSAAVGSDRFQISTDGLESYLAALESHLGGRIDYAQAHQEFLG